MRPTIEELKAYQERELRSARLDNLVNMVREISYHRADLHYILHKLYNKPKNFALVEKLFTECQALSEGIKI